MSKHDMSDSSRLSPTCQSFEITAVIHINY